MVLFDGMLYLGLFAVIVGWPIYVVQCQYTFLIVQLFRGVVLYHVEAVLA